jgi:YQGE family putative transporter
VQRPSCVALRPAAWWLLVISGLFSLSIGLSNTFVNIFIWKVDKSYSSAAWYNLSMYVIVPFSFIAAGWIAHRWRTVISLRLGIATHAAFYLSTLWFGLAMARNPMLMGAFMGLATGLFWFAFNTLSLQYTTDGNRSSFVGTNGVFASVAGMVAPPVAGYLIGREDRYFGGLTGFHVVFGISVVLFAIGTMLSFRLHSAPVHHYFRWNKALIRLRNRDWRLKLIGCFVYGIREGVFLFLIGLLFFVATGSELKLGEFFLLQSGLAFVSNFLAGRVSRGRRRVYILGFGAVGMMSCAFLFLLPVTASRLVLYGSFISVVLPFFLVPLQSLLYRQMETMVSNHQGWSEEHVVVREFFENAGRVFGIAVFLALGINGGLTVERIAYFAFSLGFVQLGTWVLFWRSERRNETRVLENVNSVSQDWREYRDRQHESEMESRTKFRVKHKI